MKCKDILKIFDLTYVIIYFDTTPDGTTKPEWEGWSLDVPWWIADSEIIHEDCDNRVYYDPNQDNPNKRTGLILIVKEPD